MPPATESPVRPTENPYACRTASAPERSAPSKRKCAESNPIAGVLHDADRHPPFIVGQVVRFTPFAETLTKAAGHSHVRLPPQTK